MKLKNIQIVKNYIRNNNKLSDFLSAQLGKDVDINTYLQNREGEYTSK